MIGWVLEVMQEPGSGFWEIRVGTEAMVELMTVETLAQQSCASMQISRLTMLDFERMFPMG